MGELSGFINTETQEQEERWSLQAAAWCKLEAQYEGSQVVRPEQDKQWDLVSKSPRSLLPEDIVGFLGLDGAWAHS